MYMTHEEKMHFYFLNSSWNQEFKFQEYFNSQNTTHRHTHTDTHTHPHTHTPAAYKIASNRVETF